MSIASTVNTVTQPLSQLLPNSGSSSSTAASSATSNTQANINGAQKSLAGDQQTFLTLLTAQLKNQDPLSPTDTNQFTQQLVAMTGVQQQITTNQLLQQLVNQQVGVGDPVSLIGKTVTASTPSAQLQNSQASWLYSVDSQASDVSLQVTDSLGRVVWQQDAGSMAAGEHGFSWNGKDVHGAQQADGGVYTLSATASGANGQSLTSHVYTRGVAQSVQQSNGQTLIEVNGVGVPMSAITSVGSGA